MIFFKIMILTWNKVEGFKRISSSYGITVVSKHFYEHLQNLHIIVSTTKHVHNLVD